MQESLIQKITRETLEKLRNSKGGKREILLVFMGGDREVEESLAQISDLCRSGLNFAAYLTPAAEKLIGREKVISSGVGRILSSEEIWDRSILEGFEAVVIPVLTMNGLSKMANMIADSPASSLVFLAARRSMKIIAASDSVICCGAPEPAATSFFMRKVNEMINTLRNLGIIVTSARNLSRQVRETLNITVSPASAVSAPMSGASCSADTETCAECGLCVINRQNDVKSIIAAGASRIASKQVTGSVGDLAAYIDHTLLKADATQEQIGKLCQEARQYKFATVCVNPVNVSLASQLLRGSGVGVTTVVGFPLGATTPTVKALETRDAIANGADEIDMVVNVGALKSGNLRLVEDDIRAVREAARGKVLKVILETALLSKEQIAAGCRISKTAGADFVKTSTGFSSGGATAEDIALMRKTVGPAMGVKASGGIRTTRDVDDMIKAGATRIGASASVAIVTGGESKEGY